jgi:hypothetical protein
MLANRPLPLKWVPGTSGCTEMGAWHLLLQRNGCLVPLIALKWVPGTSGAGVLGDPTLAISIKLPTGKRPSYWSASLQLIFKKVRISAQVPFLEAQALLH